jgi:hypothetical protein
MESFEGDESLEGINADPILQAAFVAELERVVGADELTDDSPRFQWLLPVSGLDEILAILRRAPSGLGRGGLEAMLRAEIGTLSGMKAIDDDSDQRDV